MEISNGGTGQYFLNKLNVKKIKKSKENVSSIKTMTLKERHSQLHSHRYIFQYTASHTFSKHAGSSYDVTHVTSIRGDRDVKTWSCFIIFVNKEYKIQIIRAVYHHLW